MFVHITQSSTASADGVLVVDKVASVRMKEHIKDLNTREMYVERRWGWFKILDQNKTDSGMEFLTKKSM